MSEEVKEKTLADYQKEYNQLAPQVGDISYRIVVLQQELSALYQKMNEVNVAAAALKKDLEVKQEEKKDG